MEEANSLKTIMVHLAVNTVQKQAHIVKTVKIVLNLMAAKAVITAQAQAATYIVVVGAAVQDLDEAETAAMVTTVLRQVKMEESVLAGAAADKAHAAALAAMVLLLSNGEVRI